jgi:hypothetical protein
LWDPHAEIGGLRASRCGGSGESPGRRRLSIRRFHGRVLRPRTFPANCDGPHRREDPIASTEILAARPGRLGHFRWKMSEPLAPYSSLQWSQRRI